MATIDGTAGDDSLTGTSGDDVFHMEQGGNDTVSGGDGNDDFYFGAGFTSADQIDGGAGKNRLLLDGDYSAGVVLTTTTMTEIDALRLAKGFSYSLSGLTDANVGHVLAVAAGSLGASDNLDLDASGLIKDGLRVFAGEGDNSITGGSGDDFIYSRNGNSTLHGGEGVDQIFVGEGNNIVGGGQGADQMHFGAGANLIEGGSGDDIFYAEDVMGSCTLDGGAGNDTLEFDSINISSNPIVLESDTFKNIENLVTRAPCTVNVIDDVVAKGGVLTVDGFGGLFNFDGHVERHGAFALDVSSGGTLIGGAGNDTIRADFAKVIEGGGGQDVMASAGGDTSFLFTSLHDSKVAAPDEIQNLLSTDTIDLSAIDADVTSAGNQAFTLVSSFTGHAGQLTVSYDVASGFTTIAGDVNGDGVADFAIHADGDHHDFTNFVL